MADSRTPAASFAGILKVAAAIPVAALRHPFREHLLSPPSLTPPSARANAPAQKKIFNSDLPVEVQRGIRAGLGARERSPWPPINGGNGSRHHRNLNGKRSAPKPRFGKEAPENAVRLTPTYNLFLLAAFSITVISLMVALVLSLQGELSGEAKNLFSACTSIWQVGAGAIVGLIAGKSSDAYHANPA